MSTRLVILAFVLALLFLVYRASGLGELVTLEAIQANKDAIRAYAMDMKLLAVPVFAALYTLAVALSLPFATLLSLLAGFLFGTLVGLLVVVLSATAGAATVFLLARYALGRQFVARYGQRLAPLNRELERNALYHMLFLRLVPLFPFFLVNVAPAFTRMRLRTFALATLLGIIPGAFVYVNAGNQLGELSSTAEIFSPALILSFALLGLFALLPVAVKKWRARRNTTSTG